MIFRILEDHYAQKSKLSKADDQRFMQLSLTLGRRGQGRTWPNPAVGAVVVKDGVIVGRESFTWVSRLLQLGQRMDQLTPSLRGAEVFVFENLK